MARTPAFIWPVQPAEIETNLAKFWARIDQMMVAKPEPYEYRDIEITNTVDGDTVDMTAWRDIGFRFDGRARPRVRLLGINTPEIGQPGYKEADQYLDSLVFDTKHAAYTWKADTFGRWLAHLIRSDELSVSAEMLKSGHADLWRDWK